jgi:hypothetical protein
MLSFEEATSDLTSAAEEFLRQLANSRTTDKMPKELPPVARRLWRHCKAIVTECESQEFEEIAG